MPDWTTLEDHIRSLLKDGKRSQHDDFQRLFRLFGEEKIREMATRILREEKENVAKDES